MGRECKKDICDIEKCVCKNCTGGKYLCGCPGEGKWVTSCKLQVPPDIVNNPPHYTSGGIDTLDYIQAKETPEEFEGYLKGNILKYASRYKLKNGVEDLKKAEFYIKRLIKHLEGEK